MLTDVLLTGGVAFRRYPLSAVEVVRGRMLSMSRRPDPDTNKLFSVTR